LGVEDVAVGTGVDVGDVETVAVGVIVVFVLEEGPLCIRNKPPMTAAKIVATATIMAAITALSNLKGFFGDCTTSTSFL